MRRRGLCAMAILHFRSGRSQAGCEYSKIPRGQPCGERGDVTTDHCATCNLPGQHANQTACLLALMDRNAELLRVREAAEVLVRVIGGVPQSDRLDGLAR